MNDEEDPLKNLFQYRTMRGFSKQETQIQAEIGTNEFYDYVDQALSFN